MMLSLALLLAAATQGGTDLRAEIRAHAQHDYGDACHGLALPDSAFIPLEVADAPPVTAVTYGGTGCGRFFGTGGVRIEFWTPQGMARDDQMYGFDTPGGRLVSLQSGLSCPGGDGSNLCWVTYRWNAEERIFEIVDLALETAPLETIRIAHGWEEIGD